MFKSFEDLQAMNKDSIEAFTASNAAFTKGYKPMRKKLLIFLRNPSKRRLPCGNTL